MKLTHLISSTIMAAALLAGGALVFSHSTLPAHADPATGTITGQVVWNAPLPVPYGGAVPGAPGVTTPEMPAPDVTAPDAADTPDATTPDTAPDVASPGAMPAPGMPVRPIPRPPYPRLIPAGAVLVAIQGTNLSARSNDQGRFQIDNVPTGQYVMVAVGPVQNVTAAVAFRPNVYIQDAGGKVDIGRLYLGQSYYYWGPVPYAGAAESGSATAEPGQVAPAP